MSYNVYELSEHALSYHAAARFRQLVRSRPEMPADIAEKIEDEILPALDYIEGWEPSDSDMLASFGTKWHDGL